MKHISVSPGLRRLLMAVFLAMLALLGMLVTLVLAQIELPPAGSVAFIQTSGPNTPLNIGDWYSNAGQGNRPHSFRIFVPCTVASTQVFTVELFDPEVFTGTVAIDEVRGTPDSATFELRAPDNTVIASTTYPPSNATNDQFVLFTTFTTNSSGCGTYTLLVSTGNNDDNAWRLRITPDNPDGVPGSGDELLLASFEASFQHASSGCQNFNFFVPVTPSIRLNNFDMDFPNLTATVRYNLPGGNSLAGTASGPTAWNGGTSSTRGGDVFNNPTPGWWEAELCVASDNQYIFEAEGVAYFFDPPPIPEMTVSKDDGMALVSPGQIITYTITYQNDGDGAALDAILTEILPVSTTFVACSGGLSCGEVPPPGTGIVTYTLGTIAAHSGGQVNLTIRVGDTIPPSSTLTNTVQLDYTDTMDNDYPILEDADVNQTVPVSIPPSTPTPTPTATPIPTPSPSPPPDDDDDDNPPVPTLTPTPSDPSPQLLVATPGSLFLAESGATPTIFPVALLPETGTRAAVHPGKVVAGIVLLSVTMLGLSVLTLQWPKLKRKFSRHLRGRSSRF